MYRISVDVLLKVSQGCILSLLTDEISLGQLLRFSVPLHEERTIPTLSRGFPAEVCRPRNKDI